MTFRRLNRRTNKLSQLARQFMPKTTPQPITQPTPQATLQPTIAGIVSQSEGTFDQNNQDFDILLNALKTAGLVDALNDPTSDLTVFAPTDAAFIQLAQDFGYTGDDEAGALDAIVGALTELGNGDPVPVLQDILKYHVSAGAKTTEQIQAAETIETLLPGVTFAPNGNMLSDNEPDIADPSFQAGLTNIDASNGLIQGIDRVLIPLDIPGNESPTAPQLSPQEQPTIADIVAQSGGEFDENTQDFDILFQALEAAGLTDAVADANADLTVFAPTDAAFIQLAQDFGFEGNDEAGAFEAVVGALTELGNGDPIPVLQDVLKYHVSAGAKTLQDIQASDTISTLLDGAFLTPNGNSLGDNEPDIADPSFQRELTNIQAGNGLIQGINRVLIPLNIPGNEPPAQPKDNRPLIKGTKRSDVLFGKADSNRFKGGKGNDVIIGGKGNDLAQGGRGNDVIVGNGGQDNLRGGAGRDLLVGGKDADQMKGGAGSDQLVGNGGDDLLIGGAGNDRLFGSVSGSQTFDGGKGNDKLFLQGGTDTVILRSNEGTDKIYGFDLGNTTLGLSGGLKFEDLSFVQGHGFGAIKQGKNTIARVIGVSADDLSTQNNFAPV